MKTNKLITIITLLSLIWAGNFCFAQTAEELLPKAIQLEEVKGELEKAIEMYQTIITKFPENKPIAAKAQFHIGLCFEKLGLKQAQKAYEEVVNNYPGQKNEVALAKERLSKLLVAEKEPEGIVIKQMTDLSYTGAPSPDGSLFSYMDGETGNLAIRNLNTGKTQNLTTDGTWDEPMQFALATRISHNNKLVAYTWQYQQNKSTTYDLRILEIDNPSPRILYSNNNEEIYPAFWLSENKRLIAQTKNKNNTCQIISFNVTDGTYKVLKTFNQSVGLPGLCISQDERYIAYDFQNENNSDFNVILLDIDGDREIPLIEHPANDRVICWLPDRKELLFVSDRTGTWDLWALYVSDEGKPASQPILIFTDFGKIKPKGITQNGTFYFSIFGRKFTTTINSFDEKTGDIKEEFGKPLLGSNFCAEWSPDGQSIVYIKEVPEITGYDMQLHVLDLKTGEERQIAKNLSTILPPSWSPKGNKILAILRDQRKINEKNYAGGIYKIDVKTGQETELLSFTRESFNNLSLALNMAVEWSMDAKSIFYIKEKQILKRDLETGEEKIFYQAQNSLKYLKRSTLDNKLVFVDGKQLLIANGEDGHIKEIYSLEDDLKITNIVWSPDASFILINAGTSLWRLPANGGTIQKVYQFKNDARYMSINPNGQEIALNTYKQITEIRVMENLAEEVERIYSQNK
ncbi:tetratricopeptide repeat protein [Draconibacterium sp.]|nr:tetratricopeptide repeat protein [Draconibacterium sp.]